MSREFKQVDTSTNAKMDGKPKEPPTPNSVKEPSLPVKIPMSIVRWVCYSFIFMLLILPFVAGLERDGSKAVCGGLILGWFASQLNAIINKK